MKANLSGHPAGRRGNRRVAKSGALWLGGIAVAGAALGMLGPARPLMRAAAIFMLAQRTADAEVVTTAPVLRAMPPGRDIAQQSPPSPMPERLDGRPSEPRECRLDAGIDTSCIFN